MLLSEILNITNKVKSLNEAFKSSFLKDKLEKMEYVFSHTIQKISNQGYNRYHIDQDIYDVKASYASFYKKWTEDIIPEIFNDPEKRQEFINVKYVKNGNSLIKTINNRLKEECGFQLDIANIPQDAIGVITDIEQAKKKGYKNQLQFWVNNEDNEIRAIVCCNKIICMFNPRYSKNTVWPVSKKDYKPNFTQEECVQICKEYVDNNNDVLLNDFIHDAFTFSTYYEWYMTPKDIRNYLETNAASINKLIDFLGKYSITIYSVDLDAMQANDITEKMEMRKDYQKYLQEEKNFLYFQRARYLEKIKEIRAQKKKNNTEQSIIQLNQLCIDTMQYIFNEQIQLLQRNDPEENKLVIRYYTITLPNKILSILSDKDVLNSCMRYNYSTMGRGRSTNRMITSVIIDIRNVFELLMVHTLILQIYMSGINDLLKQYSDINNSIESEDIIAQKLQNLSDSIQKFKFTCDACKSKYKGNVDYIIKKQNNTMLNNILTEFEKVLNFQF